MPTPIDRIAEEHLRIWNSAPSAERTSAAASLYTEDVLTAEPAASYTSPAGVEQAIDGLHAALPDLQLRRTGAIQTAQNLSTYSWALGAPGGPAVVTGRDVLLIVDDRISSLYVLIDEPEEAAAD